MRRILVCVDGSTLAERAIRVALDLARSAGAAVVVLRAVEDDGPPTAENHDAEHRLAAAEAYVESVARQMAASGVASTHAVAVGEPGDVIVAEATRLAADAVVIASRGRGAPARWVHGSVVEAVLGRAPAPVVVVPPTATSSSGGHAEAPRLLLTPLDGSAFAEAALPVARELAEQLGARLVLARSLAVVPAPVYPNEEVLAPWPAGVEMDETEAATYLEQQAELLRARGLIVETEVLQPPVDGAISEAARSRGAAFIVMATHGHTGLLHALLGGTADAVMRLAPCPVLLVPVRPPGGPE